MIKISQTGMDGGVPSSLKVSILKNVFFGDTIGAVTSYTASEDITICTVATAISGAAMSEKSKVNANISTNGSVLLDIPLHQEMWQKCLIKIIKLKNGQNVSINTDAYNYGNAHHVIIRLN